MLKVRKHSEHFRSWSCVLIFYLCSHSHYYIKNFGICTSNWILFQIPELYLALFIRS